MLAQLAWSTLVSSARGKGWATLFASGAAQRGCILLDQAAYARLATLSTG